MTVGNQIEPQGHYYAFRRDFYVGDFDSNIQFPIRGNCNVTTKCE